MTKKFKISILIKFLEFVYYHPNCSMNDMHLVASYSTRWYLRKLLLENSFISWSLELKSNRVRGRRAMLFRLTDDGVMLYQLIKRLK